ncbi:MAG: hypothetical protein VKS61_01295 [Candidatus Sericytochromatia bacterium]|nr:hypothetical protein [Candidatus Sericytochromatia bacterium]
MGYATQSLGPLLGPLIGFLFTVGTLLFIALRAHKTERPGALEALQAAAAGQVSPPGEAAPPEQQAQAPEAPPGDAPPSAS